MWTQPLRNGATPNNCSQLEKLIREENEGKIVIHSRVEAWKRPTLIVCQLEHMETWFTNWTLDCCCLAVFYGPTLSIWETSLFSYLLHIWPSYRTEDSSEESDLEGRQKTLFTNRNNKSISMPVAQDLKETYFTSMKLDISSRLFIISCKQEWNF